VWECPPSPSLEKLEQKQSHLLVHESTEDEGRTRQVPEWSKQKKIENVVCDKITLRKSTPGLDVKHQNLPM
jgi:hypothetical protein